MALYFTKRGVIRMAYYLKKTKLKGRTYLSIDESFYSHEKGERLINVINLLVL